MSFELALMVNKTKHSELRAAQRAISNRQVSLILNYINPKIHRNNYIYYSRNKDILLMISKGILKNKQESDKLKNIYIVTGMNGNIITASHATKKKQKKIRKI